MRLAIGKRREHTVTQRNVTQGDRTQRRWVNIHQSIKRYIFVLEFSSHISSYNTSTHRRRSHILSHVLVASPCVSLTESFEAALFLVLTSSTSFSPICISRLTHQHTHHHVPLCRSTNPLRNTHPHSHTHILTFYAFRWVTKPHTKVSLVLLGGYKRRARFPSSQDVRYLCIGHRTGTRRRTSEHQRRKRNGKQSTRRRRMGTCRVP